MGTLENSYSMTPGQDNNVIAVRSPSPAPSSGERERGDTGGEWLNPRPRARGSRHRDALIDGERRTGLVAKWYTEPGYGFVECGKQTIFCHASSVRGGATLQEGDEVRYTLRYDKKHRKHSATNVTRNDTASRPHAAANIMAERRKRMRTARRRKSDATQQQARDDARATKRIHQVRRIEQYKAGIAEEAQIAVMRAVSATLMRAEGQVKIAALESKTRATFAATIAVVADARAEMRGYQKRISAEERKIAAQRRQGLDPQAIPYAIKIALGAADLAEDLNAVQATTMACRRLMLQPEGALRAATLGAAPRVSRLTRRQHNELRNAVETGTSRDRDAARGRRTEVERWAKAMVGDMLLPGNGGNILAAAYTHNNREWHRPRSTHPALPEETDTGTTNKTTSRQSHRIAYRVLVGLMDESPGTLRVGPTCAQPGRGDGGGAGDDEFAKETPLPILGEIIIIPLFKTPQHITINTDMQTNIRLEEHHNGYEGSVMCCVDVYDMPITGVPHRALPRSRAPDPTYGQTEYEPSDVSTDDGGEGTPGGGGSHEAGADEPETEAETSDGSDGSCSEGTRAWAAAQLSAFIAGSTAAVGDASSNGQSDHSNDSSGGRSSASASSSGSDGEMEVDYDEDSSGASDDGGEGTPGEGGSDETKAGKPETEAEASDDSDGYCSEGTKLRRENRGLRRKILSAWVAGVVAEAEDASSNGQSDPPG